MCPIYKQFGFCTNLFNLHSHLTSEKVHLHYVAQYADCTHDRKLITGNVEHQAKITNLQFFSAQMTNYLHNVLRCRAQKNRDIKSY